MLYKYTVKHNPRAASAGLLVVDPAIGDRRSAVARPREWAAVSFALLKAHVLTTR